MNQSNIQLYKMRDFSAKINATIDYIRQNIGPLLKMMLLIVVPMGLIGSILFSNIYGSFGEMTAAQQGGGDPTASLGTLGTNYMLMFLMSSVTGALLISAIYTYMKLNNENRDTRPTVMEVYKIILPKLPMLLVLMILISIVSFFGFMLFIIPGLYLMITLSLALPIFIFEEKGIGNAFNKSFKLIKGKWWSTFGLLFVTGLIAGIVSYVFAIPFYFLTVGQMFSTASEANADPEAVFAVFTNWYTIFGMAIMLIGSYLTYMIPTIALAFQYFNLSERIEGTGIRNQINEFETVS